MSKHLIIYTICSILVIACLIGCAEIKPPTPQEIMRRPLGNRGPLRLGMSKEEVKTLWGDPDVVRVLDGGIQGAVREEWIYRGRYPNLPINAGYLSETQHLIFDGSNLVSFGQ